MNKKISLVFLFLGVCWNLPAQEVGKTDSLNSPEKLLSHLVQFESMAGEEDKIGKFLVQYCQERGLHTRIFTDTTFQFNFSASLYPLESQKPNIILQSHLDNALALAQWIEAHPQVQGELPWATEQSLP